MWKTLPLRFLSYLWGSIHRIDLPVFMRRPLYMAWTRAFDCQLHEIADGGEATLDSFPNLNAFFIRRIDLARFRPLAADEMISPVDGRVNVFGEVTPDGKVEQIKGMEYRVDDLLGFRPPEMKPGSKLYYYVLYLAPGDYHRMHTPAQCTIADRRHFPGALYPVLPSIARYIPSLFVRNERVVLSGAWKHGFFSMVPVGAYNVGSMKLTFDDELDTNLREHTFVQYRPNLDDGLKSKPFYRSYRTTDAAHERQQQQMVGQAETSFAQTDPASKVQHEVVPTSTRPNVAANELGQQIAHVDQAGVHLAKGDEFARFELGSTIVVFFELDKNQTFNWNIEAEQKVRVGQRLGVILPPKKV
jgi:phosphatidylserine decarboxylase precursor